MPYERPQTVLVIDDDASRRALAETILAQAGYRIVAAATGTEGLELAARVRPDAVLCGTQMPGMDGFEVLEKFRRAPADWETPFLLVAGCEELAGVRRAMTAGADDYLGRSSSAGELVEAVRAQLHKSRRRVAAAAATRVALLPEAATGRVARATLLFSDIRGFTAISERLMAGETAQLLNAWFESACRPILGAGGSVAKFLGDGLMAVFEPLPEEPPELHARRALAAGVAIARAAHEFGAWVRSRFADRALPAFGAGVGIHSGEIMFCRVGNAQAAEDTVVGDAVNVAARLEESTKSLGWRVAASAATIALAGEGVTVGARRSLDIRGRGEPIEAAEILAVAGGAIGADVQVSLAQGLRAALSENARQAALASKTALDSDLRALGGEHGTAVEGKHLRGYRLLRKLGSGSAADVFLAETEAEGRSVALKVLRGRGLLNPSVARRFAREASLLAGIEHPNVVRIGRYAVGEDGAFIEMEYLPGGSLRQLIAQGVRPRQALALLAQMAQAAEAIHRLGIVHRDLKPANFMLRADRTVVLADFGIAKLLVSEEPLTRKGETLGTPHYLSVEQARGAPATPASDLYALGVILFEMLAGRRPYEGTFSELIAQHASAPVPRLPEPLRVFQELVDRLMAKDAGQRLQCADGVLEAIDAAWTQAAVEGWKFEPSLLDKGVA